jgi:hypothetical protein
MSRESGEERSGHAERQDRSAGEGAEPGVDPVPPGARAAGTRPGMRADTPRRDAPRDPQSETRDGSLMLP